LSYFHSGVFLIQNKIRRGSHLSASLSPCRARLSSPFSHLAATRHGVVLHARVRVKSWL
jgi:hypothetical protein